LTLRDAIILPGGRPEDQRTAGPGGQSYYM